MQDGEIVGGVLAHHLSFYRLAFFETDSYLYRILDHVVVRENRAVGVDHDARPGRLALTLAFFTEDVKWRFRLLHDRRGHERHTRRVANVSFVRGHADRPLRGVRRGGRSRG